jgi:uncharacterized SAM-binding protein YcdF (DUF218 family)
MPLPIIFIIIGTGVLMKNKRWKKRLIIGGLSLFLFFSNPYLANISMKAWEGAPLPLKNLPSHDIGIVLTGITNRYKKPNDRVYLARGADRILHAMQLYKLGLIKKILISGGSGKLIDNTVDIKEADELKKILLMGEVPDDDIIIENKSRNTHESAIECTKILVTQFPNQSVLLITSAFHIPRASACFDKQEYITTSFGTDYFNHDKTYNLDDFIVPKSSAIKIWEIILHESLGIGMYWALGYI